MKKTAAFRPGILFAIVLLAFTAVLTAEPFTCTKNVTAYDPSDPSKAIGRFVTGTKIEIGQAAATPGYHQVTFLAPSGAFVAAVCRDEEIGKAPPPAEAPPAGSPAAGGGGFVSTPAAPQLAQSGTPPPETPAAPATAKPSGGAGPPLRVLFVGNSFTQWHGIPWVVKQLAAAANESRVFETDLVQKGSYTLEQHWNDGVAGKKIADGRWDYVVLQGQSSEAIDGLSAMQHYADLFESKIRKAGAKPVLYMTWADRDKLRNQGAIARGYQSTARKIKAILAPVGLAWEKICQEKPLINLYDGDGHHPSPAGGYLVACVFYSVFYGKSPEGLPHHLKTPEDPNKVLISIIPSEAKRLQRIAWETVQENKK